MKEADALRLLKDYPRDWAEGGKSRGRSAAELARWEQRLRDREKNIEKRERAFDEKKEDTPNKKKPGRKPAASGTEEPDGNIDNTNPEGQEE